MCYFINVTLPEGDKDTLRSLLPPNLALRGVHNVSVLSTLPSDHETYYLTISGDSGCSCALYSNELEPDTSSADYERRRRKYRKKGWSQAKVERAIQESEASHRKPDDFLGLRPDVVSILTRIAASKRIAVLIHYYAGWADDERIRIRKQVRVSAERLTGTVLEDDVLYWLEDTMHPR